MSKKLYVGNLPFSLTSEKLKELFAAYGAMEEVIVITFKDSGKSKGFGFVTISDNEQADKAIQEMNGKELEGRKLFVNEARPFDPDRPPRKSFDRGGGFGGGRGGGFGGGGGRRFGGRRSDY